MKKLLILGVSIVLASGAAIADIKQLNYEGYTVWLDCEKHGPIMFQYEAKKDTGNLPRNISFKLDPNVNAQCQQTSTKPYGHNYDRGHMAPANHFDSSKKSMTEVNYMTNILPQTMILNRGAWYLTEVITECGRDTNDITVIGGAVWDNGKINDTFLRSHGVYTPTWFWKVLVKHKLSGDEVISWMLPNNNEATRNNLDKYLVSINDIEKTTKHTVNVPEQYKNVVQPHSWALSKLCNLK